MRKKIAVLIVILILSLCWFNHYNSDLKRIIASLEKNGEIGDGQLKYRAYLFGVLPVAEAIFEVKNLEMLQGREVEHLRVRAKSTKLFSKFFDSEAIFDSYVDLESYNPVIFRQEISIPNRQVNKKEVMFDQVNNTMIILGEEDRRKIMPDTQDPLSLTYRLRKMDLNQVNEMQMYLNTNQKNYLFSGKVTKKNISFGNRTYDLVILKAEVKRADKDPRHKSEVITFYLSSKDNIPILTRVFSQGMLIKLKLIEIN
ncbi:MAG: DUF3108 domain-containing protein [Candidatus Omnitrophica bacterium]|nr:DUF3108 domain-containing protein [Candidatus Omnitrophota bacterium]